MDGEQEKELRKIWSFTKDFWAFMKQYYFPDKDPDSAFWADIVSDADALVRKYGKQELIKNLVITFIDDVEHRSHER